MLLLGWNFAAVVAGLYFSHFETVSPKSVCLSIHIPAHITICQTIVTLTDLLLMNAAVLQGFIKVSVSEEQNVM